MSKALMLAYLVPHPSRKPMVMKMIKAYYTLAMAEALAIH
jgi:hypothetical protein